MDLPGRGRIFVAIAAYRDPQLAPSIEDCLAQARHPERLRFGVCWQRDPAETLPRWIEGEQFRLVAADWRNSRGPCWARSQAMRLYDGESWYLQLDSHVRFSPGWDIKLLRASALCEVDKPVLTTYPAPFSPGGESAEMVTRIDLRGFDHDGLVDTGPTAISSRGERPTPARFVAAGFLFAPGSFVDDVPYDPELYFEGEEISLAVRAFTHGYDLFHPHEHVLWHEYARRDQRKHWDDHTGADSWSGRDIKSRRKVKRLLCDPFTGRHGLGSVRTLADYESYAGVSFLHRRAQDHTWRQMPPPNPACGPDWPHHVQDYRVEIEVRSGDLPPSAFEDGAFWYVGLHDENQAEVLRQDLQPTELQQLRRKDDARIRLVREFESQRQPTSWTVIPHAPSVGWLHRISEPLALGGKARGGRREPRVFISIAAYRDSELIPTVYDCIQKARVPERLVFGICWQRGPNETLPSWLDGDRFRVLTCDWRDSQGACWARSQIEQLWDGEQWYLQLDSHHRFIRDWDAELIDQARATHSEQPVLSTAAPAFVIGKSLNECRPTAIRFAGFTDDGVPLTYPELLPVSTSETPQGARFVCGHFLFAPGSFVVEVPTDPSLYFAREETTLAVRAFTHGYDLFHPGRQVLWHEHSGSYRRRHWADHTDADSATVSGSERHNAALARVARFFSHPSIDTYGLGSARSFAEYEAYAGLSFSARRAQDYTRAHLEPPNPQAPSDWVAALTPRRVEVDLDLADVAAAGTAADAFWHVAILDARARQLHARKASFAEVKPRSHDHMSAGLTLEFESEAAPASVLVVPYTASGWLAPTTVDLM